MARRARAAKKKGTKKSPKRTKKRVSPEKRSHTYIGQDCSICGKKIRKVRWHDRVCSSQCRQKLWKKRNRGKVFRLGSTGVDGYIRVLVNGRKMAEHRYIMEEHLGRKLKKTEIVIHKNGDRKDNRLRNLKVVARARKS